MNRSQKAPFSYAAMNTMFVIDKPTSWQDRPTLKWGHTFSDTELLEKLELNGIKLSRERLGVWVQKHLSAESLCQGEELEPSGDGVDVDWVWISMAVLWERWFPERPSMEMLDASMQAGYHTPTRRGLIFG